MATLVNWGGQTNLKKGYLRLAQQYADAGMMARAKAAFIRAGGTWDNAVHRLMKTEAGATSRYGGDIGFKWGDYGVRTQAQLDQIIDWAKTRNYGRIKNLINSLGGTKQYNNQLRNKLAAEYQGKQEADTDATTAGWQGTRTTEFKRDEPETAPVLYEPSTDAQGGDDTWKQQFKGKITQGNIGAWSQGQARADAKQWRDLHMRAAKRKWGYGTDDFNRQAYIDQRNKIARRHRKMLGAGPKTLKTGEVLSY